MKISNSKKQLAQLLIEAGVTQFPDGANWAAQDGDKDVDFFEMKPVRDVEWWQGDYDVANRVSLSVKIPNWHQTVLSRDEYFHLYPVAEAALEPVADAKPTIEQLADDYSNRKDYAERKQQEADAAKADAEAKLAELVAAGRALGLALSVAGPEPELVITDWRDLQVGDVIEYVDGDIKNKIGMSGPVVEFAPAATDGMYVRLKCDNGPNKGRLGWPRQWRFIRRPSNGDANA